MSRRPRQLICSTLVYRIISQQRIQPVSLDWRFMIILSHIHWVGYAQINVTKQCKINFVVSVDFIVEVELYIILLDVCGVVFIIPNLYMRDAIFMRRANHYQLIKDGKSYIINVHKGKSNISLVSVNQDKKLISSNKKYVLLFLR